MKYKLINIGRDKVTREIEVLTPNDILKEVLKHLGSKDVELVPNKNDTGWNVFAGMRCVGEVLDVGTMPIVKNNDSFFSTACDIINPKTKAD